MYFSDDMYLLLYLLVLMYFSDDMYFILVYLLVLMTNVMYYILMTACGAVFINYRYAVMLSAKDTLVCHPSHNRQITLLCLIFGLNPKMSFAFSIKIYPFI